MFMLAVNRIMVEIFLLENVENVLKGGGVGGDCGIVWKLNPLEIRSNLEPKIK